MKLYGGEDVGRLRRMGSPARDVGDEVRSFPRGLCPLEQSNKACLFEMAVGRQRLADAQFLHYSEAGAINQAPFFVLSLRE